MDFETETFLVQPTAHTLRGDGFDASEDGTGRGTPLVPVTVPTLTSNGDAHTGYRDEHGLAPVALPINTQIAMRHNALGESTGFGVGDAPDPAFTLTKGHSHAVAVALRGREGGATAELGNEVQNCLRASQGGGDKPHVLAAMQVRRLTPVECERLQGFPDNYTAIPWRKKPADQCPDGPRYKALGNSWAVPVVRWIGQRISNAAH
jgi:DNA (cytosine-5)-methyltransferase 1